MRYVSHINKDDTIDIREDDDGDWWFEVTEGKKEPVCVILSREAMKVLLSDVSGRFSSDEV